MICIWLITQYLNILLQCCHIYFLLFDAIVLFEVFIERLSSLKQQIPVAAQNNYGSSPNNYNIREIKWLRK